MLKNKDTIVKIAKDNEFPTASTLAGTGIGALAAIAARKLFNSKAMDWKDYLAWGLGGAAAGGSLGYVAGSGMDAPSEADKKKQAEAGHTATKSTDGEKGDESVSSKFKRLESASKNLAKETGKAIAAGAKDAVSEVGKEIKRGAKDTYDKINKDFEDTSAGIKAYINEDGAALLKDYGPELAAQAAILMAPGPRQIYIPTTYNPKKLFSKDGWGSAYLSPAQRAGFNPLSLIWKKDFVQSLYNTEMSRIDKEYNADKSKIDLDRADIDANKNKSLASIAEQEAATLADLEKRRQKAVADVISDSGKSSADKIKTELDRIIKEQTKLSDELKAATEARDAAIKDRADYDTGSQRSIDQAAELENTAKKRVAEAKAVDAERIAANNVSVGKSERATIRSTMEDIRSAADGVNVDTKPLEDIRSRISDNVKNQIYKLPGVAGSSKIKNIIDVTPERVRDLVKDLKKKGKHNLNGIDVKRLEQLLKKLELCESDVIINSHRVPGIIKDIDDSLGKLGIKSVESALENTRRAATPESDTIGKLDKAVSDSTDVFNTKRFALNNKMPFLDTERATLEKALRELEEIESRLDPSKGTDVVNIKNDAKANSEAVKRTHADAEADLRHRADELTARKERRKMQADNGSHESIKTKKDGSTIATRSRNLPTALAALAARLGMGWGAHLGFNKWRDRGDD